MANYMYSPTEFKVSLFTHYEDMKGYAKYRNWVVWGNKQYICHPKSPAMSPFDRRDTTSYSTLI